MSEYPSRPIKKEVDEDVIDLDQEPITNISYNM